MSESRVGDIKSDEEEFSAILKGKIRENLRKLIVSGRIVFPTDSGAIIQIVVDAIEIARWQFGDIGDGVATGDGDLGDDLGPVRPCGGEEKGSGGGPSDQRKPGQLVVDITEDELAGYLQEDLELPDIQPKGDRTIVDETERYITISRVGPRSLLHKRRTLQEALRRSIGEGLFMPPAKTRLVFDRRDRRFRSYAMVPEPRNNAVVFFMRDVSGSMGPAERRIVTFLCTLCELWLSRAYDRLEMVHIIHDDIAERVNAHDFFHKHRGMGTICSTALKLMKRVIDDEFPATQWNIYALYLSDGFDFDPDGSAFVAALTALMPVVNQFNYGQVEYSRPGFNLYQLAGGKRFAPPGTLKELIANLQRQFSNLATASINTNDYSSALDALHEFFKKGN